MHEKIPPERLLAAILSSSDEALLTFALDGTVQTWSPGAEKLYGYTQDAPAYAGSGLLHAAISGEFPHCENTEPKHKDGTILRVSVGRNPIRNDQGEIM